MKKEIGTLTKGDCFEYNAEEYIIYRKEVNYVRTFCKRTLNAHMFTDDVKVEYLGKGKIDIEFCDKKTIQEAARELSKYLDDWHLCVRIKDNQLHVYWDKDTDRVLPDIWGIYPVKYIGCFNKVIE